MCVLIWIWLTESPCLNIYTHIYDVNSWWWWVLAVSQWSMVVVALCWKLLWPVAYECPPDPDADFLPLLFRVKLQLCHVIFLLPALLWELILTHTFSYSDTPIAHSANTRFPHKWGKYLCSHNFFLQTITDPPKVHALHTVEKFVGVITLGKPLMQIPDSIHRGSFAVQKHTDPSLCSALGVGSRGIWMVWNVRKRLDPPPKSGTGYVCASALML